MWNLLRNAVKFTPSGGNVRVRSINAGDNITISVRDTGIGIEPRHIDRLFIPFEQVSPGTGVGLGLGLAICRGLAEAHQGKIEAHSDGPGHGSTFEVTLQTIDMPMGATTAPAATASASDAPANGKSPKPAAATPPPSDSTIAPSPSAQTGLRIMLVEDHRDTAQVMSRLLKSQGHRVEVATSLGDALALANEPFDLAISDITLPDGSGWS